MAEERVDIVVTDKVDNNVEKKILGIASASDKGASSVQKLKSALADINVSSVTKLQQASASMTNALARELNATARLETARSKGALADAKAAVETQRLATETAKTEAAQLRAAAAASSAERAQLALAAAQARTASAGAAAAATEGSLGNAVQQAKAAFDAGEISIRKYVAAIQAANAANSAAVPGMQPVINNTRGLKDEQENLTKTSKGLGATNANILAQFNDLGVQFAMAANSSKPLQGVFMALIQQGSQLAYIASVTEGGWKGIVTQAGAMLLKFAPLIVAVTALYGAFNSLAASLTKDSGLEKMGKDAGLTRDELKKLGDTAVTVTDVIQASFEVLSENLLASMGLTTDEIKSFWADVADKILYFMKAAFVGIAGIARALFMTLKTIGENIVSIFYNAGVGAANVFIMAMQKLANGAIDVINLIGAGMNKAFGTSIPTIAKVNTGVNKLTDGMREMKSVDVMGEFVKGGENAIGTLNRIGQRARKIREDANRRKIADILADRDPKKGPKGKEDHTAENRAHALDMVNLKLDDELKRMKLLKDERAVQQRMDQIEEQLAQKKIKLNDIERKSIEDKVRAIESYKYVQAELDRIYESATAPLRTYTAAQQAIGELLDKQAISIGRAAQEHVKANRAYQEAIDPLFAMKEAMTSLEAASGLYGQALQQQNYYEGIRQAMLKDGDVLSANYVAGVNAEVDALMRRNQALQQQQFVQQQVGAIVNPILEQQMMLDNKAAMYAEIDRMRQADVLKEQQAQQAKYALDAKFSEMRLQGASSFFGEMAGLASHGNGVIAGIGKAAAVAQATIDGYVAVQKALASAPPPWNYAMAAAVAVKTGVQVAGIMSTNVGNFATGGQFMVDGRGGVDNNNINMNVSRGERVTIETPAQQRAAANGAGATNVEVPVKIVNIRDPKEIDAYMASEEGGKTIFNHLSENPNRLKAIIGEAN